MRIKMLILVTCSDSCESTAREVSICTGATAVKRSVFLCSEHIRDYRAACLSLGIEYSQHYQAQLPQPLPTRVQMAQ